MNLSQDLAQEAAQVISMLHGPSDHTYLLAGPPKHLLMPAHSSSDCFFCLAGLPLLLSSKAQLQTTTTTPTASPDTLL